MQNPELPKIKTHGLEFVAIVTTVFVFFLMAMFFSYRLFIDVQVRRSPEFQVASYFMSHSKDFAKVLGGELDDVDFKDISVSDEGDVGDGIILFDVLLKDGRRTTAKISVVKVLDFWMVWGASVQTGWAKPRLAVSTYQIINMFLEAIDQSDNRQAEGLLALVQSETTDPNLTDLLSAYLESHKGNATYAMQILSKVATRIRYARMTMHQQTAQIHFGTTSYDKAIESLNEVERLFKELQDSADKTGRSYLLDLPISPLLVLLDPGLVAVSARNLKALSYYNLKNYELGLQQAEEAMALAKKIEAPGLMAQGTYIKGLNLYALGRAEEALKLFNEVIDDPNNTSRAQKAWAYFFKGEMAAKSADPSALGFFEQAIMLDPLNSLMRHQTVTFLIGRNQPGDLELALAMALRGKDLGVEAPLFQEAANRIAAKLGLNRKY